MGLVSNTVNTIFRFFLGGWVGGGIRLEIVDFGPLPGPTRPRRGLGKALAGAPFDLHRFSAR